MEKRTKTYLLMAHVGALASLGVFGAWLLDWPDFVKGLMIGLLLLPVVIAPLRRMRDEYIDSLWQAGTGWAFVAIVACFLLAPFLGGMWAGLIDVPRGQSIPVEHGAYLAILMFFAGFHVKWLSGKR